MGTTQNSKTKGVNNRSARHSTPLSSASPEVSELPTTIPLTGNLPYLGTSLSSLLVPADITIEGLIDESSFSSNNPPTAAILSALHEGIVKNVLPHVNSRGQVCDRSMRELAKYRKQKMGAEREAEERKRMHEDERRKRLSVTPLKRERHVADDESSRPPAVGAHGVARQDGHDPVLNGTAPQPDAATAVEHQGDATMKESGTDAKTRDADADAELEHQPAPAVIVAQYQSFGDDPLTYNDPTVYGIRDLTPDMSEDEKKEILSVATYPHDDLSDLRPGIPEDRDYSIAKPANQVTFGAFMTYLEPYVRQLTEEDVAFLKERADREEPFLIPARGTMHYRQVWAKEDGGLVPRDPYDGRLPPNEARGSIEDMNDEVATTEEVSSGPLLARLLAVLRHEPSQDAQHARDGDGDVTMTNGDSAVTTTIDDSSLDNTAKVPNRPATYFPDLVNSNNSATKPNTQGTPTTAVAGADKPYATLEQRMLSELQYHGLLTPEASPEYDGQFDDQVAERLRLLQSELRTVCMENAARKARVLELTEERMAMQEYSTIADDLDNQINAAYTKRNRTMNRPKKGTNKGRPTPGGINGAGVGVGRNTVSEGVRMLMERRLQWRDQIGPVVEYGRKGIPADTVFDDATMDRLLKVENEIAGTGDEA